MTRRLEPREHVRYIETLFFGTTVSSREQTQTGFRYISTMAEQELDVVIVGAGAAGLRAAMALQDHTDRYLVLEREERVGGRIRTIERNGFLLDRGFQIFLTAYPEARDVLRYDDLNLQPFMSGAIIRRSEEMVPFIDPERHPFEGISSVWPTVGTLADRWRIWRLRVRLGDLGPEDVFDRPEQTTADYLRDLGFSEDLIESFFRPFFSGVFLEEDLNTSSRLFEFLYGMFGSGQATLPAGGMETIPRQMADRLDEDRLRLGTNVSKVSSGTVRTDSGESIDARAVLVATGPWELQDLSPDLPVEHRARGTSCCYFSLNEPPITRPLITINAGDGLITSLCFPSVVAPSYGDGERHLASVSTLSTRTEDLEEKIRSHLRNWFGKQMAEWEHLETFRVSRSLPVRTPDDKPLKPRDARVKKQLYVAGDYCHTPSINGALASGRRAAESIVKDLDLS